MAEFSSIKELAEELKKKLDLIPEQTQEQATIKKKIVALYAFNGTGKTRLSNLLSGKGENGEVLDPRDTMDGGIMDDESDTMDVPMRTLCYNAFVEDIFHWNNDERILRFDAHSSIIQLVIDLGLEDEIKANFTDIISPNDLKIEPFFDFENGEIIFQITSGDDQRKENIKISKGEESVFIWSVFYTILKAAIFELILKKEKRGTTAFDNLELIIIDDPVSSIDDSRIIAIAVKIAHLISNDHIGDYLKITREALEKNGTPEEEIITTLQESRSQNYSELNTKFLLTSHHVLYYNVIFNSFGNEKRNGLFRAFSLSKNNHKFILNEQGDSPFSHHLVVKEIIEEALNENRLEKYHFNLFRTLLEKTSNFLGYRNWYECITGAHRAETTRLLNHYSHNRLAELENNELSIREKELFQETFYTFMKTFNWSNK